MAVFDSFQVSRSKNQKPNISRIRLSPQSWYWFVTAIWVGGISAYAVGYWYKISNMGGHVSFIEWMVFVSLLFVLPIVIWMPFLISEQRVQKTPAISVPAPILPSIAPAVENQEMRQMREELGRIHRALEKLVLEQHSVKNMIPSIGDQRPRVAALAVSDLDAPKLPLAEHAPDLLALEDLAITLDFADQVQKGDWANALAKVEAHGGYLELVKLAEKTIETLEAEGIYVEDLALETAPTQAWRQFACGVRNPETDLLAGIKDSTVQALIRLRMRNDEEFRDLSLRFQKSFIAMLERMEPMGHEVEFNRLNQSRAGRAFIILGQISGMFASRSN